MIRPAGQFPETQDVDEFNERLVDCIWVSKAGTLSGVEDFHHEIWNLRMGGNFLESALHALDDGSTDAASEDYDKIGKFVRAANDTITKPV